MSPISGISGAPPSTMIDDLLIRIANNIGEVADTTDQIDEPVAAAEILLADLAANGDLVRSGLALSLVGLSPPQTRLADFNAPMAQTLLEKAPEDRPSDGTQ